MNIEVIINNNDMIHESLYMRVKYTSRDGNNFDIKRVCSDPKRSNQQEWIEFVHFLHDQWALPQNITLPLTDIGIELMR